MKSVLDFIEKIYLSVTKTKNLIKSCFENEVLAPLAIDVQEKIMDVTFRNPLSKNYSPPLSFQKFFFRHLIDSVEKYGSECSDSLVEAYAEILSLQQKESKGYRIYKINENCNVTLEESCCFVTNSTTGLQTWEASKYLAEWCVKNKPCLENKTILELGSGIGLLGITVLKLCEPKKYIFSDKSYEVLKILSSNININIQNPENYSMEQHQLVWSNITDDEVEKLLPDVILGADVVYDTDMIESLVDAVNLFLKKSSSCAYIAAAIRSPKTNELFLAQLGSLGLKYIALESHDKSMFIYNQSSIFRLYKILKESLS